MAQIEPDILKRSVTREETEALSSTTNYWIFPYGSAGGSLVNMPYEPPDYWSRARDFALRDAYRKGGQWASAVNIAVTRASVGGYELDGDIGLRVKRAREMLGNGWIDLLTQVALDYLTCDNGAFIEIVRASKGYGAKVLGLVRLSSFRCIRTGSPDIPVVYVDRLGQYHELKSYQVAEFSDMPDEDLYGVGLCATSRAWSYIYEHKAVSEYFKEKATGRRPLSLEFIGGMGDKAIESALDTAQQSADKKGARSFMGVAITGNANPVPMSRVSIPLASMPDGFSQGEHEELSQIRFANALGIDPSELNPRLIGNRALGAGSQAQVLDDKQESKGLISLRKKLAEFLNDVNRWHVLPGGVTFRWSERDLRDQQAKAAIEQTRAATRAAMIADGTITAQEARQLAVDAGDLPESFITQDLTTEETLTDEDKAIDGTDTASTEQAPADAQASAPDASAPAAPVAPAPVAAQAPAIAPAAKELAEWKRNHESVSAPAPNTSTVYWDGKPQAITYTYASEPLAETIKKALAAFKAAPPAGKPTEIVAMAPAKKPGRVRAGYWEETTKELEEYARLLTISMRNHCPQKEGETARSIKWKIDNRNSAGATLRVYVGKKDRPEVAIRSVLFGRRGFGPKTPGVKALKFYIGGEPVYAKKVRGALAQDWLAAAWDETAPQRSAMEERLARAMDVAMIEVSDIPGAIKRTKLSQIQAPKDKRRKKKSNEVRARG